MEALDYNNYFAPAPHVFGYLGFGNDASVFGSGAGDKNVAMESMETSFDANGYVPSAFDYNFNASTGTNANGTRLSNSSSSASPIVQPLSLLQSDSFENSIAPDFDTDGLPAQDGRSNSVDKDPLTPAQSRRKAQNRAAQRAFRERKERHVRDLEIKLNLLTTTTSSLQTDNERLKLLLQKSQTENENLKATRHSSSPPRHQPPCFVDDPCVLSSSHSTKSTSSSSSQDEPYLDRTRLANGLLSTKAPASPRSEGAHTHLLSANATWDLLQSHPLFTRGGLDIGVVCERLKHIARCDGMGPVFDEGDVRRVIEEVGGDGTDGLI